MTFRRKRSHAPTLTLTQTKLWSKSIFRGLSFYGINLRNMPTELKTVWSFRQTPSSTKCRAPIFQTFILKLNGVLIFEASHTQWRNCSDDLAAIPNDKIGHADRAMGLLRSSVFPTCKVSNTYSTYFVTIYVRVDTVLSLSDCRVDPVSL